MRIFPEDIIGFRLPPFLEDFFALYPNIKEALERYLPKSLGFTALNHDSAEFTLIKSSVIEPTAKIGNFSLIRNSYIGANVKIGAHVEIANSIVLSGSIIPHHNYIGLSCIGHNVALGGNVRTAVRRLDGRPIKFQNEDKTITIEKLGCIVGNNCRIGSATIINPGTIVCEKSVIEPCAMLAGRYPSSKV